MLNDKWDNILLLLCYYYYYYYYFMYTCLVSPQSKFVSINNTFIQFFCDKHEVTTVYQPWFQNKKKNLLSIWAAVAIPQRRPHENRLWSVHSLSLTISLNYTAKCSKLGYFDITFKINQDLASYHCSNHCVYWFCTTVNTEMLHCFLQRMI